MSAIPDKAETEKAKGTAEAKMVAVPDVEGLTLAAASAAITGAKLKVGSITQQASNTVASGNVINQAKRAGALWRKVRR
jgi:beta-lactam-binding protein with PASTA domain